ncbi:MAG: hypothetical protein H6732_02415 [Alphaproteobacteria bacterium]|nr:hypothetical protein [Alphaproteobacteria bacterium]
MTALGAAWVARGWAQDFGYNLFTDRDLTRGLLLPVDGFTPGAELSGGSGARVPGWITPVVFGLPQLLVGAGARPVQVLASVLTAVAILGLGAGVGRRHGPLAAWVAATLLATHPVVLGMGADLWNPSFVVLPATVAALALLRLAHDGSPVAVAVWAAAVAVGAQLHLSMLGIGLASLPGVLWHTRSRVGRTLGLVVLTALAAMLPHVLHELGTGFANTRAMTSIPAVDGESRRGLQLVTEALALLADEGARRPGVWSVLAPVVRVGDLAMLLAPLLVLLPVPLPPAHRRALGLVGAPVVLALASYLPSSLPYMAPRYLAVLVPPLAITVAVAVDALRSRVGPTARMLTGLVVVAVALPRTAWLDVNPHHADPLGHIALTEALDALEAERGSLREVVGRTVWRRPQGQDDGPLLPSAGPAVAHLLLAEGIDHPGSLPPPCTLLVAADPERLPDAALLEPEEVLRLLRVDGPIEVRGPVRHVAAPWRAVDWVPPRGTCPTSMTQRYVDTPGERWLHPWFGRLEAGQVVPPPQGLPEGWIVGIPHVPGAQSGTRVYPAGVRLRLDDALHATLEANQLRGIADNSDWFDPAVLSDPTLVLTRGDDRVELPLAVGRVGLWWTMSPLHATGARPPEGTWAVHLRATVERIDPFLVDPVVASAPFEALLDEAWEVPAP